MTTKTTQYLAIHKQALLAKGSLEQIVKQVKTINTNIEPIVLTLDTYKRIEFSWHGDTQTVLANLPSDTNEHTSKRGRPKLGVKSKEITLLPRHWEWLATQRGGASATLRRLVEEALNNVSSEDLILIQQQQLDGFMMLFLGDEPGFEEASRALYRNSKVSFDKAIAAWPTEIKALVIEKFNAIAALHNGQA
ncbi:MAG: DUF2239 family protein [Colwellia sp.]